jgi:O-antigen ligase
VSARSDKVWPFPSIGYFTGWLRLLLVVGLLLLVVALPYLYFRVYVYFRVPIALFILALIVGIAGIIVLLRWRQLGLVILIPAALLVPLQISTGTGSSPNVAMLLVALLLGLWLLELVTGQATLEPISHVELPLMLFLVASILSLIAGQLPWFPFAALQAPLPAQLGGLSIFVLSAGTFLLFARRVDEMRWLQTITWTFIFLGALFVLGRLLPQVGPYITRLFQHGTYTNSMFWTWLVALATGQALFNRQLSLGWKLALGGVVTMTLYVGYFINGSWASGWFPPLVALAVLLALRSRFLLVALIFSALLLAPEFLSDVIARDEYSYSTRIDAWLLVLQMMSTSPILGFGPANYYHYTPLFPIRGYYVTFNSHSQYLDILAQTGLVGLFFLLWFFVGMGKRAWNLRETQDGFSRGYIYGALGGLVGTLVAGTLVDWFLPFIYNIGMSGFRTGILPWLFLGGLISISRLRAIQRQA